MIISYCENKEQFNNFYEKYANEDIAGKEWLLGINFNHTFCFYDECSKELLGCIYLDADDENRVCLNGFSKPKQMDKVIEAIKWVSHFFRKDTLFAHTKRKCAIMVLLKSGFCKINDNLLIRKAY